jgi:hypothetical protein
MKVRAGDKQYSLQVQFTENKVLSDVAKKNWLRKGQSNDQVAAHS